MFAEGFGTIGIESLSRNDIPILGGDQDRNEHPLQSPLSYAYHPHWNSYGCLGTHPLGVYLSLLKE